MSEYSKGLREIDEALEQEVRAFPHAFSERCQAFIRLIDAAKADLAEAERHYADRNQQCIAAQVERDRLRELLDECVGHLDGSLRVRVLDALRAARAQPDPPTAADEKPFDVALKQAHEALNMIGTGALREGEIVREGPRSYVRDRPRRAPRMPPIPTGPVIIVVRSGPPKEDAVTLLKRGAKPLKLEK